MIRRQKSHGKNAQAGCTGAGARNREAISLSDGCYLSPPLPLALRVLPAARLSVRPLHCLWGPTLCLLSAFLLLHHFGLHLALTLTLFLLCLSLSVPLSIAEWPNSKVPGEEFHWSTLVRCTAPGPISCA